jgi:Stress responsive A/B Barrel Domain
MLRPMLRHLVLLSFKPEAAAGDIDAVIAAFVVLRDQVPTVRGLEWGPNVSPEGLTQGYTHAFMLSFDDAAGRDTYLPHPAHLAFVERLKPVLAAVLVIDYETPNGA